MLYDFVDKLAEVSCIDRKLGKRRVLILPGGSHQGGQDWSYRLLGRQVTA